jgi:heme-degrading monooxygenase HmoA
MVTIGMNYRVLPGKNETFERAFQQVLESMEGMEGHAESHLYRDVSDPQSYLIASEWSSEEAFQDFVRSDAFARVTTWGREQILAGRPRHRVYRHG